jgi:hypothetical protein
MRYPPAIRWPLKSAWAYRGFSLLIAIILIATCAVFMPTNGHFSSQKLIYSGLCAGMVCWLLWDAWRARKHGGDGELVYAQGQWLLRQHGQEIAGTLRLHFDLQAYMLASFEQTQLQPSEKKWKRALQWMFRSGLKPSSVANTRIWVHLEAGQSRASQAALNLPTADWLSLRRAVYAPQAPHQGHLGGSHEELAI